MDLFLIILVAGWLALCVTALVILHGMRFDVERTLGRPVKTGPKQNFVQQIIGIPLSILVGALFAWPLIGLNVCMKDEFMEQAFPIYVKELFKHNDFTPEDITLLNSLLKKISS